MQCFSFYRPLLGISLIALTHSVSAALQPLAEAPLASDIDMHCHFSRDVSTDCTTTYRYTILKPLGREMLSRIDFSYVETDEFEVINAEYVQPGGQPTPLHETQIDTRTAPNPDQGFSREKQTSLAFPALRVGTQVRYTVRERSAAQPLLSEFHYSLRFAPNAVRRDRFKARFTAEQPIQWRSELMDDFTIAASADGKALDIEQRAPVFSSYINESNNAYIRRIPRIELGSTVQLQRYFGALAQRYSQIISADLPPESAIAVAAVKGLEPAQQVAELMQHLNAHYRYLGDWRASERGYVPFNLQEIEQRGYGDCKDLATLLTAMLRASGISAEIAWVSRGDVVESLLIPGTSAPNHAIVRAQVADQVWWLDPTNPVFAPGQTMSDIQDRWALVSDVQGQVREEHIALARPEVSIRLDKQAHFDRAGGAATQATLAFARLPLMQLSLADSYQGATASDQNLCDNFGMEISDCKVHRESLGFLVPERYSIKVSMTNQRALEKLDGGYFYSDAYLHDKWSDLLNYRRNDQRADLYVGDPDTVDYTVTLSGAQMDKPIQRCKVRSPWYDLDLDGEKISDGIRYHYRLTQKVSWLGHDELVSAPFGTMLSQARSCAEQLEQMVKL